MDTYYILLPIAFLGCFFSASYTESGQGDFGWSVLKKRICGPTTVFKLLLMYALTVFGTFTLAGLVVGFATLLVLFAERGDGATEVFKKNKFWNREIKICRKGALENAEPSDHGDV